MFVAEQESTLPPNFKLVVGSSRLLIGSDESQLRMGVLVIYDRLTGGFVGNIGLIPEGNVGHVTIAIEEGKGRGVATEAEYLLLKYGFQQMGIERVIASISAGNRPSLNLHEKLGFEAEGKHEGQPKLKYVLSRSGFERLESKMRESDPPRQYFIPRRYNAMHP